MCIVLEAYLWKIGSSEEFGFELINFQISLNTTTENIIVPIILWTPIKAILVGENSILWRLKPVKICHISKTARNQWKILAIIPHEFCVAFKLTITMFYKLIFSKEETFYNNVIFTYLSKDMIISPIDS